MAAAHLAHVIAAGGGLGDSLPAQQAFGGCGRFRPAAAPDVHLMCIG
jgi:hypothetical protein